MAKKNTLTQVAADLHTNVPMFYADQPAAIMLGPIVSKVTFGVEEPDDGDYPRPVVTIAIPTRALIQLVSDLKREFDSPNFQKHTAALLMKSAQEIANGGKTTPSDQMIKIPRSKPAQKAISNKP